MIDLIKQFVFTGSSVNRLEYNQYTFDVDKRATKLEIKNFFSKLYKRKVLRVNTYRPPAKKKGGSFSFGGKKPGQRGIYKRAIVTLEEKIIKKEVLV